MIKNQTYHIEQNNKNMIFIINSEIIDDEVFSILKSKFHKNKKIGFDMSKVSTIDSELFLESLFNKEFKLYNLQNEMLLYLSVITKNGHLNSYLCKNDFKESKREFIKRRFLVA